MPLGLLLTRFVIGTKNSAFVVADLFWKPFDTRFDELLIQMDMHRREIKNEIQLIQYRNCELSIQAHAEGIDTAKSTHVVTKEAKIQLEQQQRATVIGYLKQWVSPPDFSQELERAQDLREDGTAEWIFENPLFEQWRISAKLSLGGTENTECKNRALWVYGNAGSGKTILASSAVDELKALFQRNVYYFFFRSDVQGLNNSLAFLRAIAAQLIQAYREDNDIIDKCNFILTDKTDGQPVATKNELLDLLSICLESTGECLLIIDGIDECVNSGGLVKDIWRFINACSARVIMFSRPNVAALSRAVPKAQRLPVGRATSQDIRLFCSRKMEQLAEEGLLPSNALIPALVDHLVTGADGMFLWARLMLRYLSSSALTRKQRLRAVVDITLPEGLEVMYSRIVGLINQSNQAEQRIVRWIVKWLSTSLRQITAIELEETLRLMDAEAVAESDNNPEFERSVIETCAGLVESIALDDPRYHSKVLCFRFIHLSVKEYFSSDAMQGLAVDEVESHYDIARRCLQYLTFCLPAQHLGGTLGDNIKASDLDTSFPLSNYASCYWIHHLCTSSVSSSSSEINSDVSILIRNQLSKALHQLLSQKFVVMAWIEAYFTFEKQNNIKSSLELLQSWTTQSIGTLGMMSPETDKSDLHLDFSDFAAYLVRLNDEWGSKLGQSPSCIWEETTAFTPSRFVAQSSATEVTSLFADKPIGMDVSTRYLRKVSEVSSDGLYVSLLSIWPSRAYQENASHFEWSSTISTLLTFCSGWIARYELWTISRPSRRVADLRIPLNEKEIQIQLRQSLWREHEAAEGPVRVTWRTQFPVSISPDVRRFAVLRSLYSLNLHIEKDAETLGLSSVCLDLNISSALATIWNQDRHNMSSWLVRKRGPYGYCLTFSSDGRLVFFVDKQHSLPMHLAVFELDEIGELRVSLIGQLTWTMENLDQSFTKISAAFHPEKTLVAFSVSGSIFLWTYKPGISSPTKCFPCLAPTISEVTVSFSRCGMYVVRKKSTAELPDIEAIPENILHLALNHPFIPLQSSSPAQPNSSVLTLPGHQQLKFPPENVVRHANIDLEVSGASRGMSVTRTTVGIRAHVWGHRQAQDSMDAYELAKLPNWQGMDDAVPTVVNSEELVNIILTNATRTWCALSDPVEEKLPTIVRRDPRAIKTLSGCTLKRPRVEHELRQTKRLQSSYRCDRVGLNSSGQDPKNNSWQ